MAKISFYGNIGSIKEPGETLKGTPSINLSIGERKNKEETNWWNCMAYGKNVEVITTYLNVGDPVVIWGSVEQKKGSDKLYHNVLIDKIQLVGAKNGSNS